MTNILSQLRDAGEATGELIWAPEIGIGYFPVKDTVAPYDQKYFDNYIKYDETDTGINACRVDLVKEHLRVGDVICDIGIGCGAFVREMQKNLDVTTYGFDINPAGVKWLREHNRYLYPMKYNVDMLCFFDSLEHIKDPTDVLGASRTFAVVSCPVYKSVDHMLASKHFKKAEHVWYHTHKGIQNFMAEYGFSMTYSDRRETKYGREDIESFVFVRDPTPAQTG